MQSMALLCTREIKNIDILSLHILNLDYNDFMLL